MTQIGVVFSRSMWVLRGVSRLAQRIRLITLAAWLICLIAGGSSFLGGAGAVWAEVPQNSPKSRPPKIFQAPQRIRRLPEVSPVSGPAGSTAAATWINNSSIPAVAPRTLNAQAHFVASPAPGDRAKTDWGEQSVGPQRLTSVANVAARGLRVVRVQDPDSPQDTRPMLPEGELPEGELLGDDMVGLQVDEAPPSSEFGEFQLEDGTIDVGSNVNSTPEFDEGVIIFGDNVAMKIGGYVKADFIYDFNAIDSTDSFQTDTIPTSGPSRTNSRFHARQSRMSFDTRWRSDDTRIRIFVEGDFFSDDNQYRLRHAYAELGEFTGGQTWTTLTDRAAAPPTLDMEGSVSSINRRQAQLRWTRELAWEGLSFAASVENPEEIIQLEDDSIGDQRTPVPDFVSRLRLDRPWGRLQVAGVVRRLGFQPTNGPVLSDEAWGLNWTGSFRVGNHAKTYFQIVHGEGIGSYRGLPDAAPTDEDSGLLGVMGWMVGFTNDFAEGFSHNLTYAETQLNGPFVSGGDLKRVRYLAANLIWHPYERVESGVEYLFGQRQDRDGSVGVAHRVQASVTFYLP